ncbi:MAG TPA: hypothetical protein VJ692_09995 [Nitrospiraceae bacterium]|nr:hypothetical protein [Nitrospiraceae bacterium]
MPVNMNPNNRRRKDDTTSDDSKPEPGVLDTRKTESKKFGEENEEDRQKDLADAEWKNLWDATEVIDMDTW